MPVNMDPAKKRKRQPSPQETDSSPSEKETTVPTQAAQFGEETEEDRVKDTGGCGAEESVGGHGSHRHG